MPTSASRSPLLKQIADLVNLEYPGSKWVAFDATAEAFIPFPVPRPDGTTETVDVRLVFGPMFPAEEPAAFENTGRWVASAERHMFPNGRFCLQLLTFDSIDCSTVDGFRAWLVDLVHYLNEQLIYDSLGKYPGEQWAHGLDAAFAQRIVELTQHVEPRRQGTIWDVARTDEDVAGTCPCWSGQPVETCHRELIFEIRTIANRFSEEFGIDLRNHNHHRLERLASS